MDTITVALLLLLAVVVSSWLSRTIPLPLPIVQIVLGALIAWIAGGGVKLDPDIFFLLFLPPLLFLAGWRIPKHRLLRDKEAILGLAVGLVIFTMIGLGLLIHWMIPAMPLPVALALAAVVSPTDPIAVLAISTRTPIPRRLMHVLEGESLLNDASGLVCMRLAVVVAVGGAFSIAGAVGTFLWLVSGGIAIGIGVTWGVTRARDLIARRLREEPASQILISLLIPFGAYLLAELLHCSGILAAVVAGITMSYAEQTGRALAITRVRRSGVWDTVQFTVNGIIFVLLGEQLPGLVTGAAMVVRETGHRDPAWLVVYVVAINVLLALLRLVWVWVSLRFTWFRASRRDRSLRKPGWRLVAATSLAGVRGAITFAGVLTLPLILNDGSPFPARDLAIFLAAGVVIISLLAATFGLPFVLKRLQLPPEPSGHEEEDNARIASAEAAILAIEQLQRHMEAGRSDADLYADASARIMGLYRKRIEEYSRRGDESVRARHSGEVERELRLAGLRAERDELFRLARLRELPDDLVRRLVRELDLIETQFTS